MERHQIPLYLAAVALGAVVALVVPGTAGAAGAAGAAVTPVIAAMLYATFVSVPFVQLSGAVRDLRFLTTVMVLNFVAVPVVVFAVSRLVAHDRAVLVGVLLVLLAPCIDYVVAFTGLAGGAKDRLVATSPLVMVAQMALLPLYLWMFAPDAVIAWDTRPFVEALVIFIVIPLVAAILTQLAARWPVGTAIVRGASAAMVPLVVLTLALVTVSQFRTVTDSLSSVLGAALVFVLFAVVAVPLGVVAGGVARLPVPERRAVVFSGVTRNSLVVLPLALALPAAFELTPAVVVTQTMIELIVMVILVRLVPRLLPTPTANTPPR